MLEPKAQSLVLVFSWLFISNAGRMRRLVRLVGLVCVSSLLLSGFGNSRADLLIETALKPSPLGQNLERLTDAVGGRLTGTAAMNNAIEWGMDAFRAAGADSVHTESFTIPNSWEEGSTQMRVVAPVEFGVRAVSIAWGPALEARHHVPVIDIGEGKAEDFARAGDVEGKILLLPQGEAKTWDDEAAEYDKSLDVIARAKRDRALAIAFQSNHPNDLLYRETHSEHGEIEDLPMLIVAREDAGRMSRLLGSGQALYADLEIPNRIGGPVETANVIAEVKGSEKPGEVVIVGAHLDSFELGTGALDDGCGSALVVDTLRAIRASGLQPGGRSALSFSPAKRKGCWVRGRT